MARQVDAEALAEGAQGAHMAQICQHGGNEGEYIVQFQIRQGDRSAGLSWEMRDGQAREVLILQSTQGFVPDGVDPTANDRQRLVYRGTERQARLADDASTDIAYRYCEGIVYYYSVFARNDIGSWSLQLTKTAAPRSVGLWQRQGRECEESLQEAGAREAGRELAHISND
jgi:hypothetical protein